jgi:hypothetical protein
MSSLQNQYLEDQDECTTIALEVTDDKDGSPPEEATQIPCFDETFRELDSLLELGKQLIPWTHPQDLARGDNMVSDRKNEDNTPPKRL